MHSGEGQVAEVYYEGRRAAGRIVCPEALIPAPGQYVQADGMGEEGMPSVLAASLFSAGSTGDGFLVAEGMPNGWRPGRRIALRGPLGHGFGLPNASRRVALVAWNGSAGRLLALLPAAMGQGAEVTLVCNSAPGDLPEVVEIQPLAALEEVCRWADFLAVDVERDALQEVKRRLGREAEGQILVRMPMPCGAMAECGVCAVRTRNGWKMACKDGPVMELREVGE